MRLEAQNSSIVSDEDLTSLASAISSPGPSVSPLQNNIKNNINIIPNVVQSDTSSSSTSGQYLHHGPVKMPIKVTNITTSQQTQDTLHHRSKVVAIYR